jgi:hypothetical protein
MLKQLEPCTEMLDVRTRKTPMHHAARDARPRAFTTGLVAVSLTWSNPAVSLTTVKLTGESVKFTARPGTY